MLSNNLYQIVEVWLLLSQLLYCQHTILSQICPAFVMFWIVFLFLKKSTLGSNIELNSGFCALAIFMIESIFCSKFLDFFPPKPGISNVNIALYLYNSIQFIIHRKPLSISSLMEDDLHCHLSIFSVLTVSPLPYYMSIWSMISFFLVLCCHFPVILIFLHNVIFSW